MIQAWRGGQNWGGLPQPYSRSPRRKKMSCDVGSHRDDQEAEGDGEMEQEPSLWFLWEGTGEVEGKQAEDWLVG